MTYSKQDMALIASYRKHREHHGDVGKSLQLVAKEHNTDAYTAGRLIGFTKQYLRLINTK